jgi:hypothetical protein
MLVGLSLISTVGVEGGEGANAGGGTGARLGVGRDPEAPAGGRSDPEDGKSNEGGTTKLVIDTIVLITQLSQLDPYL